MISFLMQGEDGGFKLAFEISRGGVIALTAVVVSIAIALYVLRSIGVYVLAKRQEVKHAFMAWIPVAWLYTACKIIGKIKIFSSTFARLALVFTIIFGLAEVLTLVVEFLTYYPLIGNLLIGGKEIYVVQEIGAYKDSAHFISMQEYHFVTGYGLFHDSTFVYPFSAQTELSIMKAIDVISYISLFLDIASIVVTINVYIALFRKFWPQHFILATIFSFFGLFAPFVFAIRKKDEVNYQAYMQARYNARYNMYGNPYNANPYGNPYNNQGNPYGNQARQTPPEHPFSEFAERGEVDPGDPFSEYADKSKEPFSEYDDENKD